ncbi:uncharacterized protein FIBRA_01722 [Fibroporia radiculosa]|uniref:Uncharacterized protein n=1 Tax=Fibroporia radiculosa TaxID=599839 RepID=J4I8N1_9APHY|nr:uncharacterized protein FIBRA_01722 [Fibroporia radiculosa]CCL99701.1 predicted protein [Fibroporia radiculosa]
MATKLSGVFTITNTFHSNRVAMMNDNDAEPLFFHGIPHRSLGALIAQLAAEKGNNICVIVDYCHSDSSARADDGQPTHLDECIEVEAIPSELDLDLWGSLQPEESTAALATYFRHGGVRCHVLLVAGGTEERVMTQRICELSVNEQTSTCSTESETDEAGRNDVAHGERERKKQRGEVQEIHTPGLDQSTDVPDTDRSILILEDAVQSAADDDPNQLSRLDALGRSLLTHFDQLGNAEDTHRSISMHDDAARLCLEGDPNKPTYLNNLGNSLRACFRRLGDVEDIHRSISILQDAVRLSPDGDPNKSTYLNNLRNSLCACFRRMGDVEDLHRSISMLEDAPVHLNNLGYSLCTRFEQTSDVEDIHRSILMLEDAVRLSPDGDSDKLSRLDSLANLLRTRFKRLGDVEDIHRSISILEHAVQLSSDGDPNKLTSISMLENAVRLSTDDDSDKPPRLNPLGHSLCTRFE